MALQVIFSLGTCNSGAVVDAVHMEWPACLSQCPDMNTLDGKGLSNQVFPECTASGWTCSDSDKFETDNSTQPATTIAAICTDRNIRLPSGW